MKCREKILKACAFLIICTIIGLISANIIGKPIELTETEKDYYIETADKVWNEGFEKVEVDDKIYIKYSLKEKEIEVFSTNTNKQSVAVKFYETEKLITVNEPVVNYWGCFMFYGLIFGTVIYQIIALTIVIVKGRKESRRKS